jgi:hypothetical protein
VAVVVVTHLGAKQAEVVVPVEYYIPPTLLLKEMLLLSQWVRAAAVGHQLTEMVVKGPAAYLAA